MSYIITEFSKYIICIALGLYLIESIIPLFKVKGDRDKGVFLRQTIYIMLLHVLSMVSLYLITDDLLYLELYAFQLVCLFMLNRLTSIIYPKCSLMIVNHMCLLLTIGFVEVARLAPEKSMKQMIIDFVSIFIFMVIPIIIKKCKFLREYGVLYGTAGIVLLVLVFSLGKQTNGSLLSYSICGISFQPSEFAKIIFVFFLASMLFKSTSLGKIIATSIVSAIYVGILVLSKDLGSALIFFMVYIALIFVATGKALYSVIGLGMGALGATITYKLFTHVQVRIAIWLDPLSDIDKTSYQIAQSLFGIGTGGWMGMGLGKGDPTSIPFVDEDFVFSAICEEFGVIFGILLILVYLSIFVLLLKNALRIKDNFYRLVQVGLSTSIAIQTLLTIGGGTRFIPMTGVTLPLISNGGSSAMSTIFIFGICLGISLLPNKTEVIVVADTDEEEFDEDEYDSDMIYEVDEAEQALSETLLSKRRINSYIITGIYAVIYFMLIGNLIIYMNKDKEDVVKNEYNKKRQDIIASETYRGEIRAKDGTVLARTALDASGNEVRDYPFGKEYCHTVGYSGYGTTGIENSMNMYLIQSDISFSSRTSNGINNIKNPGNIVDTTLVPELQHEAYEALGMYKGAVVATKADTGEILCMVSSPGFDPNTIAETFQNLSEDKENSVLLNRAAQGIYPPGSTFKIIDTLEYIRENPDTYQNYTFNCNGAIKAGETTIHCYQHSVHGHQDLKSSLAHSCNSSFANIGMSLDKTKFADTLVSLLFNENLPVDFASTPSKISVTSHMTDDEIGQASIGQGSVGMSPLHLNMITGAIANDGVMMQPYIVSDVKSAEDKVLESYSPKEYGRVMSQEESDILTDMMKGVIEEGTAKKLRGTDYTSAGKTGSAEFTGDNGISHAWFTGFAPAENPQIVVTVILEGAGTGGDYSVPITRRIFDRYFEIYGTP